MSQHNYDAISQLFFFTRTAEDFFDYIDHFETDEKILWLHYMSKFLVEESVKLPDPIQKSAMINCGEEISQYRGVLNDGKPDNILLTTLRKNAIRNLASLTPIVNFLLDDYALQEEVTRSKTKKNKHDAPLNTSDTISLSDKNFFKYAPHTDVIFLEANSNYTRIKLVNGEVHTTSKLLKEYESTLPDSFVRISRSAIINTNLTVSISRAKDLVIMNDKSQITVTQNGNLVLEKLTKTKK